MDSDNEFFIFIIGLCCLLSGCFTGAHIGINAGIKDTQVEAVKHNAGEWIVVDSSGETTFVWKEVENAN